MRRFPFSAGLVAAWSCLVCPSAAHGQPAAKTITEADCTAAKLGATIPVEAIGRPVSGVTLDPPRWHPEANGVPAYCSVEGSMAPVDKAPTARPIKFGVALPASWSMRGAQLGGGGMNGTIPRLAGGVGRNSVPLLAQGFATYGSDSGHQATAFGPPPGVGRGGREGAAGPPPSPAPPPSSGPPPAGGQPFARSGGGPGAPADPHANDWTLNDEAVANLGHMQLKKTHDAAMVIIERAYGAKPRFNYFFGNSQGGRESLTVAQRYPSDYDGISAEVPIVNFSSLMLAPGWIRIHEKPLANYVTPAKVNAIRAEFIRQCDGLDGLTDGIINNYMACRAIFDVKQGPPNRRPWSAKRCANNVDPNPQDTSAAACLTDGQIGTLEMTYSPYVFATPLANHVTSFGMWFPTTDPSGSGLIANTRFRGQEGAAADAPMHTHLGILGVTGFLMRDLAANPLDYVEGGALNARRFELSAILDSTNPDLSAFQKRGGKLLVAIGTNDTLASPGAQIAYYQSVIDKMGRPTVDAFARFWVLPQADHGLMARTASVDGSGKEIPVTQIPTTYDRVALIIDWVENGRAPAKSITVTAGDRSLPMCSYPEYPKYVSGPTGVASSYACAAK